ncbi:uncharacterized protein LOC132192984 [Neocloeon triangulifer]|uniref:uncharacterized protein LOC132192984 n=1 Tax=Neocloeon triangulifer TaxID=2078957 RepID=UPI00286F8EC1|nr:uncharacterized protein LOC132192984 [Neocloeon triangulifer]
MDIIRWVLVPLKEYSNEHQIKFVHFVLKNGSKNGKGAGEGDLGPPPYEILDVNEVIQGLLNDTDSELSSLSHLDAPNDSVYMMSGVLIAMLLVAVIIVLLAVTISKLRKRGDVEPAESHHRPSAPSPVQQHQQQQHSPLPCTTPTLVTLAEPPMSNLYEPTTAWNYPAAHFLYSTTDQETTITPLATEQPGFCKGVRKNLGGKWKRLVRRKSAQDCPVSRDHLKQIYVY